MKKENENKYYNIEDEINFEKMNNFKKFNLDIKKNIQNKNQDIKYSNSDKNYFYNIIKTEKNVSLLNETDVKKNLDKYNNEKINESVNSENSYSSKDYDEFNKIIETKNKKEEAINNQNKKVKIIDYGKLKESEKKLKNKLGIEKIKVVYFD